MLTYILVIFQKNLPPMNLSEESTEAYLPPKQGTTLKYSKMWNPEYWRSNTRENKKCPGVEKKNKTDII